MSIEAEQPGTEVAQPPNPFKLWSVAELIALPPPNWLVNGMVEERAFGVLYGPAHSFKSFVALDWALSIATGHAWQGRPVRKGHVLYVVGEGTTGFARRIKAWLKEHDCTDVPGAFFLLKARPSSLIRVPRRTPIRRSRVERMSEMA